MSTKPETERGELIDLIIRDVCETDPADPAKYDTLLIKNSDLRVILDSRLEEAAALLAEDGEAGGEVRLDICAGYVHQSFLDEVAATGNAVDVQIMSEPFPGGAAIFTRPQQAAQVAQPLTEDAKAVIDSARVAMNESFEDGTSDHDIVIPSHLAAALSLRLDEYDRAHGIGKDRAS